MFERVTGDISQLHRKTSKALRRAAKIFVRPVKQKYLPGNSIDEASSKDGKPYSALPNAFRYRKELVPGCTCNGKDVIGLASVKIEDDKTLRRGDLVANKGGFEVVSREGNGQASFSAASDTVRKQFARLPVIASE